MEFAKYHSFTPFQTSDSHLFIDPKDDRVVSSMAVMTCTQKLSLELLLKFKAKKHIEKQTENSYKEIVAGIFVVSIGKFKD